VAAPASIATLRLDPVTSMSDAIDRMQGIAAALPPIDGLACFNRMYLTVTEAVQGQVDAGFFADAAFMAKLDVNFVNRFLAAVGAYRVAPGNAPRSWRVLFDQRADPGLAPMQFALAGMNAHINYDLAPALVQTFTDCASSPNHGPHHLDFYKVNQTLNALEPQVRESFEQGVLLELDRQFAGLDNIVDNFSITAAREAAWTHGEVLWRLRDDTWLAGSFLTTLDRTVGFAGRALLTRLPTL
jgi:hypothetical protein